MLPKKTDLTFFANAKLLLTGEYLVIYGAKALAIPLRFGQSLTVSFLVNENLLHWTASDKDGAWFKADFKIGAIIIIKSSDEQAGLRLQTILKAARVLNPHFLLDGCGYDIQTTMDFDRQWGWGTSSTLIVMVAQWAQIDPYQLHFLVNGGSAYDIACGIYPTPIQYQLLDKTPSVTPVKMPSVLMQYSYFIYLGKKQDTAKSIASLSMEGAGFEQEIGCISEITEQLLQVSSPEKMIELMKEHERIIGTVLHQSTIQDQLFGDFNGAVKSLGAWGGDFMMAISTEGESYVRNYFQNLHYPVLFLYSEIIKK